jgi:ppGpp synthetase/RelA/SpoT-type nucleotidyltranferase
MADTNNWGDTAVNAQPKPNDWGDAPVAQSSAPKVPDMSGVQKVAQDNLAANDNKNAGDEPKPPQTPAQQLDTAVGMPVTTALKGAPLSPEDRVHLINHYDAGTASSVSDYMQNALPAKAAVTSGSYAKTTPEGIPYPKEDFEDERGVFIPPVSPPPKPINMAEAAVQDVGADIRRGAGTILRGAGEILGAPIGQEDFNPLTDVGRLLENSDNIAPQERGEHPIISEASQQVAGLLPAFFGPAAVPAFALQSAGQESGAAQAAGASPQQVSRARGLGFLSGAGAMVLMENIPMIKSVERESPGFTPWIAAKAQQAVHSGISFGTLGEAQSWLSAQIQSDYNPKAEYDVDPVRTAASVLTGGLFGVLAHSPIKVAGHDELKPAVGEIMGKPPESVTRQNIDQTIHDGYKDAGPNPGDFKAVETATGGALNEKTLKIVFKQTGKTPDEVYHDSQTNPEITASIEKGTVPEAYAALAEPSKAPAEKLSISRDEATKSFNVLDTDGEHVQGGFDSYQEAQHYIEDKKTGIIPDEPPEWSRKEKGAQETPNLERSSEESERPSSITRPTVSPETQEPSRQTSEQTPREGSYTTRAMSPSTSEGPVNTRNLPSINPIYHKITDLSSLKEEAKNSQSDFDNLLEDISKNVDGATSEASRLKDEKRLSEKSETKKPEKISDYLAGRIVVDTPEAAKGIVDQLKKFANVIKIDDNMNDAGKESGYRAIHVQIEGDKGFSAEVQIQPKEIRDSYSEAREIYKKWRNRNPNENPEEYLADQQKQKSIFDTAWNKFKERVQEFSKEQKGALDIAAVKKSIGDTISAVENFTGKLTGGLFERLGDAYIKTFQPELVGPLAKRADAFLAKYKAAGQAAEHTFYTQFKDLIGFWDKATPDARMQWINDHETGRWNEETDPDHAQFQTLLDATFKAEKQSIGADADKGYKENYLPLQFDDPEGVKKYFGSEAMIKKYGADWFTKARAFDLIQDAVRAGFKLKTDNPGQMLVSRLLAGDSMIRTMDLLHDMESSGIATRATGFGIDKKIAKTQTALDEAQRKYNAASEKINDPKQLKWDFADPIVSKYMKGIQERVDALKARLNDFNAEKTANKLSPEQMKELKGGFRIIGPDSRAWNIHQQAGPLWKNAMEMKGLYEREGITGDAYRAYTQGKAIWTQVKLGLSLFHPVHVAMINLASGIAGMADHLVQGGKFSDLALKDTGVTMGLTGETLKGRDHPAIQAWNTPQEARTPEQQQMVTHMVEGGLNPTMSARDKVHFKENFDKAIAGVGLNNLRLIGTVASLPGVVMKPFFEHWIPGMKAEIYLRRAEDAIKRDPSLAQDAGRRGEVFRQIAKDTDRTYGEMNSNVQFWNKNVRDSFNAAFISGGWKLAQIYNARGLLQPGKIAYKFAKTGEFSKQDITYNMLHAYAYTGLTLALGGAINAMLGNPIGTAKDTVWDIVKNLVAPQTGDHNPDGTPIRLNQPAFAKEAYNAAHEINTKGILAGSGSFLYHQTLIPGIIDTLTNRDFVGREEISDPTDLHQWMNAGWEAVNPIAVSNLEKAQAKGSKIGAIAGVAGFPIAGAYLNQTPFEQKVIAKYDEQNPPKGDAYSAKLKAELKSAVASKDTDSENKIEERMKAEGMSAKDIEHAKHAYTKPFVDTAWKELPVADQKRLLKSASDEEKKKFKIKSE